MTKRPPQRGGYVLNQDPVYVKRRQRAIAVIAASIVLLIGAVAYIGWSLAAPGGASSASDYEGNGNGVEELVEIPEGATLLELAPELVERDIIATETALAAAAENNPAADVIQPGFYRLQQEMSAEAVIRALADDANMIDLLDVYGGATLLDVNVVGGDVRNGIYTMISNVTRNSQGIASVSVQELQHVAASVDPAELGAPEWALDAVRARGADPKRLEGLIATGQYVIDPNMSAQEILKDLISRSTAKYNETGIVERSQAIGLSPYELLISASLVEREAPAGEFDKVARVILNRLDEPMRLQFDSTVNYGLDDVEVATTSADRERVTPWNTYAMDGLPETPIATPSMEAIEAMENPAPGNWLYFVTISQDGTTVFNDNFDDHQADVQRALESGVLNSNR